MASKASGSTPVTEIGPKVEAVRQAFLTKKTISLEWRKEQLKAIKKCLLENWDTYFDALKSDLHQIELIAKFEHNQCVTEVDYMLANLDSWVAPKSVDVPAVHLPAWGYTVREPHGTVLIISPWNYPVQLTLLPTIGAVAAGNCVVIKPSELAPAISKWLATYLPKYVDNERIVVIEGAVAETTELLKQRFDLIFYTGNPTVARLVADAAAKTLTPTVLELGGKSPVIVDRTVNMDVAVKRIAFGKFTNCGQTCIAPDHVYVHKDILEEFVSRMKECIKAFYGETPKNSKDYSRIIASRHATRIQGLINSVSKEAVIFGGEVDVDDRYVAPTLILNPAQDSEIMREEIFGPVMPIVSFSDTQSIVDIINSQEKPLAIYLFSTDKATVKLFTQMTSSGSLVINETLSHGTCREIPFGGVGNSGYGNYYGKYSFNTFTHEKGIFQRTMLPDPYIKYPPYTSTSVSIIAALLNLKLPKLSTVVGVAASIGAAAFIAYSYQNGSLQKNIDILKQLQH